MNPILGSRARLGTYLLGWAPIGALLVFVALTQRWPLLDAVVFAVPLCLGAAFLFLSSWYLCRALPLSSARVGSHWTAWILAAVTMSSIACVRPRARWINRSSCAPATPRASEID